MRFLLRSPLILPLKLICVILFGVMSVTADAGELVDRSTFGPFTFMQSTYNRGFGEPVRYPTPWPFIELSVGDPKSGFHLLLHDNGGRLSLFAFYKPPAGLCASQMRYIQYEGQPGEPAIFDNMLRLSRNVIGCALSPDQQRQQLEELESAKGTFTLAIEYMKFRATILFGEHTDRCDAPPPQNNTNVEGMPPPLILHHPGLCD